MTNKNQFSAAQTKKKETPTRHLKCLKQPSTSDKINKKIKKKANKINEAFSTIFLHQLRNVLISHLLFSHLKDV